jgi:hypothetical protein
MVKNKESNIISLIKKFNSMDIDNIIDYISKNNIKNIIYILSLCDLTNDKFYKILVEIQNKSDEINFYNIIDNECFSQFVTILEVHKTQNKKKYNKILKFNDNYSSWQLLYFVEKCNDENLKYFWSIIKDINLLFIDENTNKTLMSSFITKYMKIANGIIKTDNNILTILYDIIKEYLKICPEILLLQLEYPILNLLVLNETKSFIYYSKEDFEKVKYEISSDVKKLLDLMTDNNINSYDYKMETSLIHAIYGKHIGLIKYLISKGANINYKTYYKQIFSVFDIVIKYSNKDIHNLFYDLIEDIDFIYVDTSFNSYAMSVFNKPDNFDNNFKLKILNFSHNLNNPNANKNNILHTMLSKNFKDDFYKYIPILISKKLSWSQKNIFGITPVDILLSNGNLNFDKIINELVIPNYVYHLNLRINKFKLSLFDKQLLNKINKNLDIKMSDLDDETANLIAKYEFEYMDNNDNNIILLRYDDSDYSLFTPSYLDDIIYSYCMINFYSNLGMPIINGKLENKINCVNICDIDKNIECQNNQSITICNRINELINDNDKYMGFSGRKIYWHSKNYYFIPDEMFQGIKYIYELSDRKKYVFFINVHIYNSTYSHANFIIINLKKNIAIRFEPYGNIVMDDMDIFDKILYDKLNDNFTGINFIPPKEYCPDLSFQSYENNIGFIKIGDPEGYCLAWCYWFLESYMMYEKKISNGKQLKSLLNKLFNKIIYEYSSLIDYIREYGNYLKKNQIKILKKLNFPSNRLYAKYFNDDEMTYVFEYVNKQILSIYKL